MAPLALPNMRFNGRKMIASVVLFAFLGITIQSPHQVYAQESFRLPAPGVRVSLSPEFNPPVLKGVTIHPDNPFKFDFILDRGEASFSDDRLKEESQKLVKYFLSSITTPEKDLWVNLSPYEKNRIVPESFGQTDMGRDLLAQDYLLKQITASLIYPEDEFGKKFWKRIYEEAAKKFGNTTIPVNTFNKVWIVPEHAKVYEHGNTAYIVKSRLKVMLEQDYLALDKNTITSTAQKQSSNDINALGSQIVREIVIPELEKEVNEGKNFAPLRQVYNSLILAVWFKKRMKGSILGRKYMDQNKIVGIDINDKDSKEMIYQQYLKAFKKGVYNYIKEEPDPVTQEMIPRKYFSGGAEMNRAMTTTDIVQAVDRAEISTDLEKSDKFAAVSIDLTDKNPNSYQAMEVTELSDSAMSAGLQDNLKKPWYHGTFSQLSLSDMEIPEGAGDEKIYQGLFLTVNRQYANDFATPNVRSWSTWESMRLGLKEGYLHKIQLKPGLKILDMHLPVEQNILLKELRERLAKRFGLESIKRLNAGEGLNFLVMLYRFMAGSNLLNQNRVSGENDILLKTAYLNRKIREHGQNDNKNLTNFNYRKAQKIVYEEMINMGIDGIAYYHEDGECLVLFKPNKLVESVTNESPTIHPNSPKSWSSVDENKSRKILSAAADGQNEGLLIEALKQEDFIAKEYAQRPQIVTDTLRGLQAFNRHFGNKWNVPLRQAFRIAYALHILEKNDPQWFSQNIMGRVWYNSLTLSLRLRKLVRVLMDGNPIGLYLKGEIPLVHAVYEINNLQQRVGMHWELFFEMLRIVFQCDTMVYPYKPGEKKNEFGTLSDAVKRFYETGTKNKYNYFFDQYQAAMHMGDNAQLSEADQAMKSLSSRTMLALGLAAAIGGGIYYQKDVFNNSLKDLSPTSSKTIQPKISQQEVDSAIDYIKKWINKRTEDKNQLPTVMKAIDAAFRQDIHLISQKDKEQIERDHDGDRSKEILTGRSYSNIVLLLEVPTVRQEFFRKYKPMEILRMFASFKRLVRAYPMPQSSNQNIDNYIDLLTPQVLAGPEGYVLSRILLEHSIDIIEVGKEPGLELINTKNEKNQIRAKKVALKLSAKGKIDVLIKYLQSNQGDSADAISLLSEIFKDLPEDDQKDIVDAYMWLIFNAKDADVRVEAQQKLFTIALSPQYRNVIDEVYQKQSKVNTLPNKRASEQVELIVYDDFKGQQGEKHIHGEMVLSRILTGLLGKDIDLTRKDFKEQLGISGEFASPMEAARKVLRSRKINLHAVQANQENSRLKFDELLKQNQQNTVVVNISMGGYMESILGFRFEKEDPSKVNGAFPIEMFKPSVGRDHLIVLSAGNGREFVLEGSKDHYTLGKPRIYTHPIHDQFIFSGAASLDKTNGQWNRKIYSDWGPDVHSYASTGPWEGTSFSAPFETGVALKILTSNPTIPVKVTKDQLTQDPGIQKRVQHDDGYSKEGEDKAKKEADKAMFSQGMEELIQNRNSLITLADPAMNTYQKSEEEIAGLVNEVREAAVFEPGVRYRNDKVISDDPIRATVDGLTGPKTVNVMRYYRPSSEVGVLFQGHGIKKGETLKGLLNLLTNGIHQKTMFYTGALNGDDTSEVDQTEVHYEGDFILVSKPERGIDTSTIESFDYVMVAPSAYPLIEKLQAMSDQGRFIKKFRFIKAFDEKTNKGWGDVMVGILKESGIDAGHADRAMISELVDFFQKLFETEVNESKSTNRQGMSRRDFLKRSTVAAAATALIPGASVETIAGVPKVTMVANETGKTLFSAFVQSYGKYNPLGTAMQMAFMGKEKMKPFEAERNLAAYDGMISEVSASHNTLAELMSAFGEQPIGDGLWTDVKTMVLRTLQTEINQGNISEEALPLVESIKKYVQDANSEQMMLDLKSAAEEGLNQVTALMEQAKAARQAYEVEFKRKLEEDEVFRKRYNDHKAWEKEREEQEQQLIDDKNDLLRWESEGGKWFSHPQIQGLIDEMEGFEFPQIPDGTIEAIELFHHMMDVNEQFDGRMDALAKPLAPSDRDSAYKDYQKAFESHSNRYFDWRAKVTELMKLKESEKRSLIEVFENEGGKLSLKAGADQAMNVLQPPANKQVQIYSKTLEEVNDADILRTVDRMVSILDKVPSHAVWKVTAPMENTAKRLNIPFPNRGALSFHDADHYVPQVFHRGAIKGYRPTIGTLYMDLPSKEVTRGFLIWDTDERIKKTGEATVLPGYKVLTVAIVTPYIYEQDIQTGSRNAPAFQTFILTDSEHREFIDMMQQSPEALIYALGKLSGQNQRLIYQYLIRLTMLDTFENGERRGFFTPVRRNLLKGEPQYTDGFMNIKSGQLDQLLQANDPLDAHKRLKRPMGQATYQLVEFDETDDYLSFLDSRVAQAFENTLRLAESQSSTQQAGQGITQIAKMDVVPQRTPPTSFSSSQSAIQNPAPVAFSRTIEIQKPEVVSQVSSGSKSTINILIGSLSVDKETLLGIIEFLRRDLATALGSSGGVIQEKQGLNFSIGQLSEYKLRGQTNEPTRSLIKALADALKTKWNGLEASDGILQLPKKTFSNQNTLENLRRLTRDVDSTLSQWQTTVKQSSRNLKITNGKLGDAAMVIEPVGGIDLTADRMKLGVDTDKAMINQPLDLKALENIEINALYIKNIEIKPLNNLPELLGVSL